MAYRKKQPEEEPRQEQQEPEEKPVWDPQGNHWYQTAAELMQSLQDRPAFSYDPGADPLYLQARDLGLRQGRRAMEDTLGQSAARTGGFASTYAQGQGQQAYDRQIEQLSKLLPDYYDRARAVYDSQGKQLQDLLGAVTGLYDKDYQAWLDKVDRDRQDREDELDEQHWQQIFDRDNEQWLLDFDRDNDHWQQEFEQQLQQWEAEFDRDQEHWEAQQQGSADSQAQAQQARERSYAYRMAMVALQHGLRVSDKLLQAAGIDKAYAEMIRQYYATHGKK